MLRCPCGWSSGGDVLDFTSRTESGEQAHYDALYERGHSAANADLAELEHLWRSLYYPMNERLLDKIGDVRGKNVLLLGNGTSEKELFLLQRDPRLVIFSDLSAVAVRAIRDRYSLAGDERIVFAAIDAQDLPLADESVDIVYAYAVVHHLPDVDRFLAEAVRVLHPGGRCVLLDDAFSPAWQGAKRTVLRPLMRYFHRLEPVSPEDLRFTLGGGFREEELASRIRAVGGVPWFERMSFVHYLVTRASERLPPRRLWQRAMRSELVLRQLISVDDFLSRYAVVRRNQIRLIWGFDKPADRSA